MYWLEKKTYSYTSLLSSFTFFIIKQTRYTFCVFYEMNLLDDNSKNKL